MIDFFFQNIFLKMNSSAIQQIRQELASLPNNPATLQRRCELQTQLIVLLEANQRPYNTTCREEYLIYLKGNCY